MIGLLVVQALRWAGAPQPSPSTSRKTASPSPASSALRTPLNPATSDVAAEVARLTGGLGASIFEVVGVTKTSKCRSRGPETRRLSACSSAALPAARIFRSKPS